MAQLARATPRRLRARPSAPASATARRRPRRGGGDLRRRGAACQRARERRRRVGGGDDRVALLGLERQPVEQPRPSASEAADAATASATRPGSPSSAAAPARAGRARGRRSETSRRIDRGVEPELAQRAQRGTGSGSRGEQPQLGAEPRAADRVGSAPSATPAGRAPRVRLDREPEPAGVAGQPQQPRRVVDEAPRRGGRAAAGARGHRARPRALSSSPRALAAEAERDRVDREVAAREVLLDRSPGATVGQRPGARVGLARGRGRGR